MEDKQLKQFPWLHLNTTIYPRGGGASGGSEMARI